jgi:ABC-type dipeptide/oligopeptide/nickel transport system permease subunit
MTQEEKKNEEKTISGIDVMRGVGVQRARPFWADAWHRVVIRRGAQIGLIWIGIVAFFALFAPVIANGLPLWSVERSEDGELVRAFSPLFASLTATDLLLVLGGILGPIFFFLPLKLTRQHRLGIISTSLVLGGLIVVLVALLQFILADSAGSGGGDASFINWVCYGSAIVIAACLAMLPTFKGKGARVIFAFGIALFVGWVCADRWTSPVLQPERFVRGQIEGTMENTYTLIPWSPTQSRGEYYSTPPARTTADAFQAVADDQIEDGIGFLARTVVFNLASGVDGLPLDRDAKNGLVNALICNCPEELDLMSSLGFSDKYIILFNEAAAQMAEYRRCLEAGDLKCANNAATGTAALFSPLKPSGRNAKIAITDALSEFKSKIADRIQFVQLAKKISETEYGKRTFYLGTDPIGRDVLAQMLWACRLSISIGLVSTGLSVLIGIVIGALMGYFGGWVDMVLSRIVEIFMAVPVLFLLIVAASALPRNTYVMMAIIGCVTWTGSARFIRAEFLKLRNQDFVQSCRAVGLPLHSVLFRHMLPNGVTPVLVQASFGVAAAIIAEATLSYLGLGPYGQPSWGKLLSLTTGETGVFLWWMAVFPGLAIFLTVLAYNVLGENFRDAIDPKMRKAAH